MKPSLMLLLSSWCDCRFLGDDGEQHYALMLGRIGFLAVKYNMDRWHCWITVTKSSVSLSIRSGAITREAVFDASTLESEDVVRWCIQTVPEMYDVEVDG